MRKVLKRVIALTALWTLAGVTAASAQIARGGIVGTVRDASGGVVPGATVTITHVQTNAARVLQTETDGAYRAGALEPGNYTVKAELAGFTIVELKEVVVRSGLETPLDIVLKPAAIGEQITVVAESSTVGLNKTTPTIATTINARGVVELPLAGGRNINNLVLTVPNSSQTTGQGTYAINGNRPRNNNYMIDGSDNNDISVTISTSQIVPEAVQEFQVLQNPYSVEFGRNSGGQINVITRSGSNRFSGDVFDYYQSAGLNSLNNIEKTQGRTVPAKFIRHQAGGDIGGPILKDKVFFFGLYQRDSQQPGPRPGTPTRVPTAAGWAALQNAPLGAGQTAAGRQAVQQRLSFLTDVHAQNPTYTSVSNITVNGVPVETGLASINIVDPSRYHTFLGRGDYRLGDSDTFTFRYSLNDRLDDNAISNCVFGSLFCGYQDLVDTNIAVSNAHIFSPRILNEARFSLVRRNLDFPENDPDSPTATITGLFTIGGFSNFPQSRVTDAYQFTDTLTWTLTKHTVKVGADIRFNVADNQAAFDSKGTFVFNNLQDYWNNLAFSLTQAVNTSSWYAEQWQTFWYVQDDFRVTPDLTINLGLRYEVSDVPLGMFGATDQESLAVLVPGPVKKDNNNWAPRAGFAWSPRSQHWLFGDGRTSIRGGFGVGYDILFYNLLVVNASNYPRVSVAQDFNVQNVYPNLLPKTGGAPVFNALNTWTNSPSDTENPEQRFYSLTWQRELATNYLIEAGYSGSRGYKGINQIHANPAILTEAQAATARAGGTIPALQARRVNAAIGPRTLIPAYVGPGGNDVEARSQYDALFVSTTRRFARGLQFSAGYTFSRWMSNNDASLGEGGTESSSQRPQSMFNYEAEWSRSNFDRPHRLATSYIWEIPGPKNGFLSHVIGGWQVAGVTSAQSGRPFTILTGVDSSGDGNIGSDRPNLDPSGSFTWDADHRHFTNNGRYVVPRASSGAPLPNSLGDGNAGRNTERTRHAWNTDLSLMKRFSLGGDRRLMVRIDAFNALNQDNYGGAPGTAISATFNQMSSANFGVNTFNWGRRILQLSGKVSF